MAPYHIDITFNTWLKRVVEFLLYIFSQKYLKSIGLLIDRKLSYKEAMKIYVYITHLLYIFYILLLHNTYTQL